MTQIKSQQAREYVEVGFMTEYADLECNRIFFGEECIAKEVERIGRCRHHAEAAIIIAETEAHDSAMESNHDEAILAAEGLFDDQQLLGYYTINTFIRLYDMIKPDDRKELAKIVEGLVSNPRRTK